MNSSFNPTPTHYEQTIRKEQVVLRSRTDVATTKRAFQDLNSQISKLREEIISDFLGDNHDISNDTRRKRAEYIALQQQLKQIESAIPMPQSSSRLTEEEKKQIKGLYLSGLYTQQQLANQYGVTQPTISDIVK